MTNDRNDVSAPAPTKRRGPRGPYAKSAITRAAILEAAFEVFAQSGYRAGSIRQVADRVGISEAGLLHHFDSKSALLAAVLDHRDQLALERFDFASPDGMTRLRSVVALAEYNATIPGVVELFTVLAAEATAPDHPAHEYFRSRYDFSRGMITEAFTDLAERGMLVAGLDPARAARTTVAVWDGLQLQWLLDRDTVDIADELRVRFAGMVTATL